MDQGENEQALALILEKMALYPPDSEAHLSLLNTLGYVYCNLSDYDRAEEACDAYIDFAQKKSDLENLHIGYHQKAMVLRLRGDYPGAMDYVIREKELLGKYWGTDNLKLSVNEYEQGYLLYRMHQPEAGLSHMERSLEHALKTDDLIAQACAYRGLGEICKALCKAEQAERFFDKAADTFLKAGDPIGAEEIDGLRG